ncbi:MAG: LysM peptidoglycan-binding domain-containing protein [Planctomycetes bacterium]|nr:LysM peptidoglycan-binding domain-containing protein [Planctomycetota bacterium]
MSDATNSSMPSSAGPSAVRPAPNKTTSVADGAAKVFREFKWGLLTLFLLMVVVIGLVYDGGRKKTAEAPKLPATSAPPASEQPQDLVPGLGPQNSQANDPHAPRLPDVAQPPDTGSGSYTGTGTTTQDPRLNNPMVEVPPVPPGPPKTPKAGQPMPIKGVVQPDPKSPETAGPENVYVVQPGDSLSSISNKNFPGRTQTGIKAILAANKDTLPDPNRLKVGMKLKIPALAEKAPVAAIPAEHSDKPAPAPKLAEGSEGTYTVQAGDTLEKIARKLYKDGNRWNDIYEQNRDKLSDPSRLKVGMQLKVSGAKESISAEETKKKATEPGKEERSSKKEKPTTTAEKHEDTGVVPAASSNDRPMWMP